jgi:hypothetical protein
VLVTLASARFPSNPQSSKMAKIIVAELVLTVTKTDRFVDAPAVPAMQARF